MEVTFSWGWFFGGLALIIASAAYLRYHKQVADALGGGVGDYERYKLYAVIALGIGFAAMLNLVPIFLNFVFGMIFGRGSSRGTTDTVPLEEAAMMLQYFL